mmetsp:Transcript_1079/g.3342  ORF Transcript_1079/g.3342 Transcript_1079/m.3342 type:complete len:1089 (-) Transcript_1079:1856-5122(-)
MSQSNGVTPAEAQEKQKWVKSPIVIKPGAKFEPSVSSAEVLHPDIDDGRQTPDPSVEIRNCALSTARLNYSLWLDGVLYINGMHNMDTFIDLEKHHGTSLKEAGVKICECSGFVDGDGFNVYVPTVKWMFVEFCERVRIILDEAIDFVHVENSKFIEIILGKQASSKISLLGTANCTIVLEKQGVDVKIEAIASEYVNILQIDSRKTQSSSNSQDASSNAYRMVQSMLNNKISECDLLPDQIITKISQGTFMTSCSFDEERNDMLLMEKYPPYLPIEKEQNERGEELIGVGLGLRAQESMESGPFIVGDIVAESAAAREGTIEVGDVLVSIDSILVLHMSMQQVLDLLRGPLGSTVVLVVLKPESQRELRVHLQRTGLRHTQSSHASAPEVVRSNDLPTRAEDERLFYTRSESSRRPTGTFEKYIDLTTQLGFSLRLGIDGIYFVGGIADASLIQGDLQVGDILHSIDGLPVTSRPFNVISSLLEPSKQSRKILALLGSRREKAMLFHGLNEFSSWKAVIIDPVRCERRKKSSADILIDVATEEECQIHLSLHPSSFSRPINDDEHKKSVLHSMLINEVSRLLQSSAIRVSVLELLPEARTAAVELRQPIQEGESPIEVVAERLVTAINTRTTPPYTSSSPPPPPEFFLISSASLRLQTKRRNSAISQRGVITQQSPSLGEIGMKVAALIHKAEGREILSDDLQEVSKSLLGVGLVLYWDELSSLPRVDDFYPTVPLLGKEFLQENDFILAVDGNSTRGEGLARVMMWIAGEERRRVELQVVRGESFCCTTRRARREWTLAVMRGSGEVIEVMEDIAVEAKGNDVGMMKEETMRGEEEVSSKKVMMNGDFHTAPERVLANGGGNGRVEIEEIKGEGEYTEASGGDDKQHDDSSKFEQVGPVTMTIDGLQADEFIQEIPEDPILPENPVKQEKEQPVFNHPPPVLNIYVRRLTIQVLRASDIYHTQLPKKVACKLKFVHPLYEPHELKSLDGVHENTEIYFTSRPVVVDLAQYMIDRVQLHVSLWEEYAPGKQACDGLSEFLGEVFLDVFRLDKINDSIFEHFQLQGNNKTTKKIQGKVFIGLQFSQKT